MENDNIFLAVKAAIVAACAAFTAAFGWLGWLVVAWVVCMTVDYISGSAAAAKEGNWSSEIARAGIWHKAGMIFVVFVAAATDAVLGTLVQNIPGIAIDYSVLVLPLVLAWYILTELGSIAENAAQMGAPVPAWLVKVLAVGKRLVDKSVPQDDEPDDVHPPDGKK